jgi:hypothetical protein
MGKNDKNGKKRGWNKKFRKKNNINIKYKMSERGGGLLPAILLTQSFVADVTIKRANEYGYDIFVLTLDKLIGQLGALLFNPYSKEFVTKQVQGLDVTGLIISLATGSKLVIRVETRDGDMAAYQLLGVKEENGKGKVKMAVKPIGEGAIAVILQKKVLRKAKMELIHIWPDSLARFTDPSQYDFWAEYPWADTLTWKDAKYDYKKKTLKFVHIPEQRFEIFYSAAARVPFLFEFKSSSSSEEGEVIKAVAKVECVKVDGDGCHVKLSNKGLNCVGKTVRRAITALDKVKSGSCSVKIQPLAIASDRFVDGIFASDMPGATIASDWIGYDSLVISSDIPRAKYPWSTLDVENGAVLKKTKKVGVFELQFRTKEGASILYKDDKDTIRSKPVKSYLKVLAGNFNQPFPNDSCENGWWCGSAPRIVEMKTASGKEVIGVLTDLRWNANNEAWVAKVGLRLADDERLQTRRSILDEFKIWIW